MGDGRSKREEREALKDLPNWVPEYLACWGSKKPDGGRMTVTFAAEFAGTTASNVRDLRARSPMFRRLEELARNAGAEWASSYIDAGLRGMTPLLIRSVYHLLLDAHPTVTLKLLDILRNQPQRLQLEGEVGVGVGGALGIVDMSDEELDQLLANLDAAEEAGVVQGVENKPDEETAGEDER